MSVWCAGQDLDEAPGFAAAGWSLALHAPRDTWRRAMASRTISVKQALVFFALALSAGITSAYFLGIKVFLVIIFYTLLNVLYSLKLKHIALLDVVIIAVNFVLRIITGGIVAHVPLSLWIILMAFLLSLFLALAKRRDDLVIFIRTSAKTRKTIDNYNLEFINASMIIMAAVTIVAYIMYAVSPDVISKTGTDKLYLTVFFVILGILRYLQITFVLEKSGSPTEVVLKDFFIQSCLAGWIFSFVILIYIL